MDANLGGVTDDDLLGDFGDNFNILEFADALGNLNNNNLPSIYLMLLLFTM